MTCYASHYVYVPGRGFLKQWGVEVADGHVVRTFQLTEEREGVEWHPGVIVLVPDVTRMPLFLICIILLILAACSLPSELGADDCCSDGYVQRLGGGA